MEVLKFDELVPGASVRFTVKDGVQYLSIRDLIMVVCEKDNNDAGQIWRRLPDDKKNEISTLCRQFKFPGQGQSEQPVITIVGAIKLVMMLPGENAKDSRIKAMQILSKNIAPCPYKSVVCTVLTEFDPRSKDSLKMPRPEYVYAIHSESFPNVYKIGRTRDLRNRIIQLNISMPYNKYRLVTQYVTYYPSQAETHTHYILKEYHVSGEHYRVPWETLADHFNAMRQWHLTGRDKARNTVHLKRAFVSWALLKKNKHQVLVKSQAVENSESLNDVSSPRVNLKRKADAMEVRDLTPRDVVDIQNAQRISTLKLGLIERSLDIYFRMGPCPEPVRAGLLAEVQPRIQALVDVRVQENLVHSYIEEETILLSRMTQIERISRIADVMNKYYGSTWAETYPEQYKVMEQELRLQGLGFSIF